MGKIFVDISKATRYARDYIKKVWSSVGGLFRISAVGTNNFCGAKINFEYFLLDYMNICRGIYSVLQQKKQQII